MIELSPSIYEKGLKWNLKRINMVDTVSFTVLSPDAETVTIATGTITNLKHGTDDVSLPIGKDTAIALNNTKDEARCTKGLGKTCIWNNGPYQFAHGIGAIYVGEASFTVTSQEAILEGSLQLSISVKGQTYEPSSALTYSDYPNIYEDSTVTTSTIQTFVKNHSPSTSSVWTSSSAYKDYDSSDGMYFFPFVRLPLAANGDDPSGANLPPLSYIITRWNGHTAGESYDRWSCASSAQDCRWSPGTFQDNPRRINDVSTVSDVYMWPAQLYSGGSTSAKDQRINGVTKGRKKFNSTFTQIDDYNVTINLVAPIRYVYCAAAQFNHGAFLVENGYGLVDAKAFIDDITEINYTLVGQRYNAVENEYAYSMDWTTGLLTTNLVNQNVFKFDKSLFWTMNNSYSRTIVVKPAADPNVHKVAPVGITVGMTESGVSMIDGYPQYILSKYRYGGYTCEAVVQAEWCIANNVDVGTQMQVLLPNNTYIRKKIGNFVSRCVFEVKNITKTYEKGQFNYRLQLVEKLG